jgi:hypothetical protein
MRFLLFSEFFFSNFLNFSFFSFFPFFVSASFHFFFLILFFF